MLKKLSDEKIKKIMEAGISEFAQNGLEHTSMNSVAKLSGISVGVLYKYFSNKDDFFMCCLRQSLKELEVLLQDISVNEEQPLEYVRSLIKAIQKHSREHSECIRMYHQITISEKYAPLLVNEIEGVTSRVYTSIVEKAQKNEEINGVLNPNLMAFFVDNLFMMLQFSYCCSYYKERFKLYCGEQTAENDELVEQELLSFIKGAFFNKQKEV